MALFIRQDEQQSKLREKVSADLRSRMTTKAQGEPDDVMQDSHLVQDQHTIGKSGIIIGIAAVIAVIFIIWMFRP